MELQRLQTIYENTVRQLESFRNTGYKMIIAHMTLNISICASLLKKDVLMSIQKNPALVYIGIFVIWILFFWWQIGLYLSGGRLNKILEQCQNKLADGLIELPKRKKGIFRRYIPASLVPFITTLIALFWSYVLITNG